MKKNSVVSLVRVQLLISKNFPKYYNNKIPRSRNMTVNLLILIYKSFRSDRSWSL
jgi:hypothetical protein